MTDAKTHSATAPRTIRQIHAALIARMLRVQSNDLRAGAVDKPGLRKVIDPIVQMHEAAADAIEGMLREADERGWGPKP